MKNITTIERIAMQKTAMQKTAIGKTAIAKITAKITTTALLFFLALFTLTMNLKAQETQEGQAGQQKEQQAKKGGWFVGFTPYLLGLSEQKSSSTIVSNPTGSTVDSGSKIFSFTAEASAELNNSGSGNQAHAQETTVRLCETGFANADGSNTGFSNFQFALVDGIWNGATYPTNLSTHCQNHFAELLASAPPQAVEFVAPSASPKAATAKWSGAGLHFGYEFPEGDRFSLQLHNWKGGDIEVSSQMVVYDYFLSKNFYAGVGSGTIELKALGETQSQRGSAINLGWQYSFSPSFKLELGYLLLSAEASITKEIKETRNVVISRTEVEAQTVYVGFQYFPPVGTGTYTATCAATGCNLKDSGIKVTSDPLNSEIIQVYEVTETQEVTVSNPSAIYIRLTVGF